MKIFLSWSGSTSKAVATSLRTLLQDINYKIQPWMSETDLQAGARWGRELADQLAETNFGVICATREALESPWLLLSAFPRREDLEMLFAFNDLPGELVNWNQAMLYVLHDVLDAVQQENRWPEFLQAVAQERPGRQDVLEFIGSLRQQLGSSPQA